MVTPIRTDPAYATFFNAMPQQGGFKPVGQQLKEMDEAIAKLNEELIGIRRQNNPNQFLPEFSKKFYKDVSYERELFLVHKIGVLTEQRNKFAKDNNLLEDDSLTMSALKCLTGMIPKLGPIFVGILNRGQNTALQAQLDTLHQKINDVSVLFTDKFNLLIEFRKEDAKGYSLEKAVQDELVKCVEENDLDKIFEQIEVSQASGKISQETHFALHAATDLLADIYAKKDQKNAHRFKAVASGIIDLSSYVDFKKLKSFGLADLKNLGSLALDMGTVVGVTTIAIKVIRELMSDPVDDPLNIISQQIRDLGTQLKKFEEAVHLRFDQVEITMMENHLAILKEFGKLHDITQSIFDICKSCHRLIEDRTDLLLKIGIKGFAQIQWIKFRKYEKALESFLNDPEEDGNIYKEKLEKWCEVSDGLCHERTLTGLQPYDGKDSTTISALKDQSLDDTINFLAEALSFPKQDYANFCMWMRAVLNYVKLRKEIREKHPNIEKLISQAHYGNFIRLYEKGEQLKELIAKLQKDFVTNQGLKTLQKELNAYKESISLISKLNADEFIKKFNNEDSIFIQFEANFLKLCSLIRFMFNTSYEYDKHFLSFLTKALPAKFQLSCLKERLDAIKDKDRKNFAYTEFFSLQDQAFSNLEQVLKNKAQAAVDGNKADNLVCLDFALDQLDRLEKEVYPAAGLKKPNHILLSALYMEEMSLFEEDLFFWVKNGDKDKVKRILSSNASLVAKEDNLGRTAIHYAAMSEDVELIKLLLDKSKNQLRKKDLFGNTPFHLAAEQGKTAIIDAIDLNGEDLLSCLDGLYLAENNAKKNAMKTSEEMRNEFAKYAQEKTQAAIKIINERMKQQRCLSFNSSSMPNSQMLDGLQISCTKTHVGKCGGRLVCHDISVDVFNHDLIISESNKNEILKQNLPHLFKSRFESTVAMEFSLRKYGEFCLLNGLARIRIMLGGDDYFHNAVQTTECIMAIIDTKTKRIQYLEQATLTNKVGRNTTPNPTSPILQPAWFIAKDDLALVAVNNTVAIYSRSGVKQTFTL